MPHRNLSGGPPLAASSSFARQHAGDSTGPSALLANKRGSNGTRAAAQQPGFSSALMQNRYRKVQEQQRADEPQYDDMDLSDGDEDFDDDIYGAGVDSGDEDEEGGLDEAIRSGLAKRQAPPSGLLEVADSDVRISDVSSQYRWNQSMKDLPLRPIARSYDVSYRASSAGLSPVLSSDGRYIDGEPGEIEEQTRRSEDSMSDSEEEEESENEQERCEWQNMLANVLEGDVLKSEKNRLSGTAIHQLDDSLGQRKYQMNQIWVGVRAFVRNRSLEAEQRFLHEARAHITKIFSEVANFKIVSSSDDPDAPPTTAAEASDQVQILLAKTNWAISLYPSLAALRAANELANKEDILARLEALQSWITITSRLQMYLGILQKWTGSETLEITKPNLEKLGDDDGSRDRTPPVEEASAHAQSHHHHRKILDSSTFVERLLKEESLTSTFAKGILTDIYPLVQAAKETIIANRAHFVEIGLPPFSDDLIAIINFPMNLMREAISLRLDSAARVNTDDPFVVLSDQLTDDFRAGLTLANQMKKKKTMATKSSPRIQLGMSQSHQRSSCCGSTGG